MVDNDKQKKEFKPGIGTKIAVLIFCAIAGSLGAGILCSVVTTKWVNFLSLRQMQRYTIIAVGVGAVIGIIFGLKTISSKEDF